MRQEVHAVTKDLERVDASIDTADLAAILLRDGAAIVRGVLPPAQLAGLNAEFDDVIAATEPGLRNPAGEFYVEFYGSKTIRLDGLPARSTTFVEIMQSRLLTGLADKLLLPNCEDYLLNTGQLIQIGPGESAQMLHRDEDAWPHLKQPKPLLQVEAMFALTDFTVENGATQVVPGSHLWPPEREARPDEILRADMPAGSALIYLGSTMHGGGANVTGDQWRRGMFFGFVVGWLRTEENTFLTVPLEKAREMPERVQELLGYKAHGGIGVVDVGSPMVLLK
jgi:ectoine hydroxylase-related dioxygenase (phytanoyl-CoA dioxygenase family)